MSWTITTLDDADLGQLMEISTKGTLNGSADPIPMLRLIAKALIDVGVGQKQTAEALQEMLNALGIGK